MKEFKERFITVRKLKKMKIIIKIKTSTSFNVGLIEFEIKL
jgi:hypothetical protein